MCALEIQTKLCVHMQKLQFINVTLIAFMCMTVNICEHQIFHSSLHSPGLLKKKNIWAGSGLATCVNQKPRAPWRC